MNQILSLGLPLGKRIVLSGNDGLSLQEPEAEARSPSNLSRAPLYVLALLILVALLLAPLRGVAAPDQAKGKTPWAMVLCTYPEAGVRGNWQPRDWEALFVPGTGGLTDYFREVSYGAIDVSGSRVFGWFTLPYAKTEAQRTVDDAIMTTGNTFLFSNTANFHDSDAGKLIFVEGAGLKPNTVIVSVRTSAVVELSSAAASTVSMVKAKIQKSREALIEDCAHAAESQVHFPDYYGIIAVRNDAIDADATARSPLNLNGVTKTYGKLLLADWWLNVTHIGHEMLHGYGLEHSRSDMPSKNADGTALTYTEYGDPWDIMSAMVVNGFPGTFGMSTAGDTTSGPGMNAANLDLMGWMPATKRWVWNGIPGSAMLSPLNAPEGAAPLVAIVPLGDPLHYYTVELRRADHWDRGFATTWQNKSALPGRVLIHEVKVGEDGNPHSYLRHFATYNCSQGFNFLPESVFNDRINDISITVTWIAADASLASVSIGKNIPAQCGSVANLGGSASASEGLPGSNVDKCTTCGPGNKTPMPRHNLQ